MVSEYRKDETFRFPTNRRKQKRSRYYYVMYFNFCGIQGQETRVWDIPNGTNKKTLQKIQEDIGRNGEYLEDGMVYRGKIIKSLSLIRIRKEKGGNSDVSYHYLSD
uniref:Uncharacterized protein n=1 Tax=Cacopsylla melanoneura TaxID=428564 RepID=A0A8D8W996_9HEMI